MKHLHAVLDDESQAVLEAYQKEGKFSSRDAAINALLREFKKLKENLR